MTAPDAVDSSSTGTSCHRCGVPPMIRRFCATIAGAFSTLPGKERRISGAIARIAQIASTNPSSSVIVDQLTRALGEAVIRIWSKLPQEVQDHLFKEAV